MLILDILSKLLMYIYTLRDYWAPRFDRTVLFYLLRNLCGARRGARKVTAKKRQSLDVCGYQSNLRV